MATKIHEGAYCEVRCTCPVCGMAQAISAIKKDQEQTVGDVSTAKCHYCNATFKTPRFFLKRTGEENGPDNPPNG